MMRIKLPARRRALTLKLVFTIGDGQPVEFFVTYGFDDAGRPRECFCLPFKSGVDLQALMRQSCMAVSVALQWGASMEELAHVLGEDDPNVPPRSMLGLIVRTGAHLEKEFSANSAIPKPEEKAAAIVRVEQSEAKGPRPRAYQSGDVSEGSKSVPTDAPPSPAPSLHGGAGVACSDEPEIPAFLLRRVPEGSDCHSLEPRG